MKTTRLETFSDGVLAIILTIMVLALPIPRDDNFDVLEDLFPVFVSYILSFIYIGIYWNNHHHLLQGTEKINGGIMWANLHLLFWLSLIPFVTGWMGLNHFYKTPVACYGFVLLMSTIAFWILQRRIIAHNGAESDMAVLLSKDYKGKISPILYVFGIAGCYFNVWIAGVLYVAVAFMWFIPDRKIEAKIEEMED